MKNRKIIFMIIIIAIFSFMISACSNTPDKETTTEPILSLENFEEVFLNFGAVLDIMPDYAAVGAKDGRCLLYKGQKVIVYEYESEDVIVKAIEEHSELAAMPRNERFLLDSGDASAVTLFTSIAPGVMIDNAPSELTVPGTVNAPKCKITINSVGFSEEVLPEKTDGESEKKYSRDAGYIYIDIDVQVMNTSGYMLACDGIMGISISYDGREYTATSVVEKDDGSFLSSAVNMLDPNETAEMRYIIKCPEGARDSEELKTAILTTYSNNYTLPLR